jgi:hypothetical protein
MISWFIGKTNDRTVLFESKYILKAWWVLALVNCRQIYYKPAANLLVFMKTNYDRSQSLSVGKAGQFWTVTAGFHSGKWTDRTGLSSILYYPHRWTKKVENTSTLHLPGCGSQVQTGTENWYQKPMCGFNLVSIWSDPMLIFLSQKSALKQNEMISET